MFCFAMFRYSIGNTWKADICKFNPQYTLKALNIIIITMRNDFGYQSSNSEQVFILHSANALEKGMNPVMGK